MSTTTARGRRKRSRDQGDSAAATSSDSAAATSTSQLHTDALAHVAAAYAAVDGYAVAREEKAAQRNPNPSPSPNPSPRPSPSPSPNSNPNPNPNQAAQRAAGVFRDGIQYGEVSAASFARCLEWVQPVAGEIFFDLGSAARSKCRHGGATACCPGRRLGRTALGPGCYAFRRHGPGGTAQPLRSQWQRTVRL